VYASVTTACTVVPLGKGVAEATPIPIVAVAWPGGTAAGRISLAAVAVSGMAATATPARGWPATGAGGSA
jgi:hypothetical protein